MATYEHLAKRPKHFTRLIALTLPEFDEVFDKFYSAWYESERERSPREGRKREYGDGRHAHLRELQDKLVYVRIYPLLFVHGMMFNLSEGKKHDKLCLDEEDLHCRDLVDMGTDLGFQGYQATNITEYPYHSLEIYLSFFSSNRSNTCLID